MEPPSPDPSDRPTGAFKTPSLAPALALGAALGLGLLLAGFAVSKGLERFRMADRSITVKGLAERSVEADYATWTLAFRRGGNSFAEVQQSLKGDRDRVVAFLKGAGFKDDEIEVRPLEVQDLYSREYAQTNQPFRYNGNAREQGLRFAAEAGATLGPLRNANQGVITISGEDEGDDRASRMKRLRVVSTFEYELR